MKPNKGYIAISAILVIAAVVLIIGTSVSLLSINDIQSAFAYIKGGQSLHLVEGCVEDALLQLNNSNSLPSSILIPEGTCTVTVNSHSGNDWTFTTSGTFSSHFKSVKVSVTRESLLSISSWIQL